MLVTGFLAHKAPRIWLRWPSSLPVGCPSARFFDPERCSIVGFFVVWPFYLLGWALIATNKAKTCLVLWSVIEFEGRRLVSRATKEAFGLGHGVPRGHGCLPFGRHLWNQGSPSAGVGGRIWSTNVGRFPTKDVVGFGRGTLRRRWCLGSRCLLEHLAHWVLMPGNGPSAWAGDRVRCMMARILSNERRRCRPRSWCAARHWRSVASCSCGHLWILAKPRLA